MILISSILLFLALGWLSLPPRGDQRWSLLAGFALTVAWLVGVALWRGLSTEFGSQGLLWLLVLAALGAPLVQLLVWSAVAMIARPRGTAAQSASLDDER